MPCKGANSVLFDFWSLIDREITIIKYCMDKYPYFIDMDRLKSLSIPNLEYQRMYGKVDLLNSLIVVREFKDRGLEVIDMLFTRDEKDILDPKYVFNTLMVNLINAYEKTGNGVIKTTIRCDDEIQKDYALAVCKDANVIISERKDIDTTLYGRVIVSYYKDALEFDFPDPTSIIVLKYAENMIDNMINPELIINFGDVNKIGTASPFNEDDFTKG